MGDREIGHFEFHTDGQGDWRWTKFEDASTDFVFGKSSEGYRNRSDCESNARRFGYEGKFKASHMDDWTLYRDADDKWRWTREAPNGEIVGTSHQAFSSKTYCRGNAIINGYPND